MGKINFFVFFYFTVLTTTAQKPVHYWSFDGRNIFSDTITGQKVINQTDIRKVIKVNGVLNFGLAPSSLDNLLPFNLFRSVPVLNDFTLEFAFKSSQFTFLVFPKQNFRLNFSLNNLYISYTVSRNNKVSKERWDIPLVGSGITSYNNLADNQWHHLALVARKSGSFEIWIDGKTDSLFKKAFPSFDNWVIDGADGFRLDGAIDELAFYASALSRDLIQQHALELKKGQHYSFLVNSAMISQKEKISHRESYIMDEKEFAPGYPNYTVQATDQLKAFPLPRYASGISMPRNFPWMDITYLHRELPGDGGKGFGKVDPQKAVQLTAELANNWNYYIELPTLRIDSATAQKRYESPTDVFSSLIDYANRHPQIQVATVLMQVQNKPAHAGFNQPSPYVTSKKLADKYYLQDKSGKPIVYSNKKWLSPFTSTDIVRKDGLTSAFYINQLAKHLTRKIDMINENGEWFGHKWPQQLLEQSPEVVSFLKKRGMDYDRFSGWMQNQFDSVYRTSILQNVPWSNVAFTFYNVSAYNSAYWPEYRERIRTNSLFKESPRSTPAFYPARPDNWRVASGPSNGYGTVAEGRKKEMALGIKFFAPFISAGWSLEENNIRPAQWLGLLKSMVMLGADFFHVGYFNVTGKTGWLDGKGPNDPRGYIYQAAMPAYAQAIASQVWDFLDKGMLLQDSLSKEKLMPFAFAASSSNHLVLVRKLGKRYLIYGTVQPNSNYKDNAALEALTSINLEGKKISFNIRRQGSMYVFDLSGVQPVFYQIDGWHQYEHPYYWDKPYSIEAEVSLLLTNDQRIRVVTNCNKKDINNFSNFTTHIILPKGEHFSIPVFLRAAGNYVISIRSRVPANNITLEITFGNEKKRVGISGSEWTITETDITISSSNIQKPASVNIMAVDGTVEIDWIKLKTNNK
ncbi:LamG domain-containing protein [Terrimonas sp.]|uniref:LamG domain-containing protein n=1 Tax=Terrimonas sp. TaxID=1914338 RepID=UPI001402A843|nr:LamG domain-containing protein [Terrimonas sp.]